MFVMGEVSPPLVYMSSIQWRASPYSCTLLASLPNPGHPLVAPVFLNTSDNFNSNELEIAFTNMVRFFLVHIALGEYYRRSSQIACQV